MYQLKKTKCQPDGEKMADGREQREGGARAETPHKELLMPWQINFEIDNNTSLAHFRIVGKRVCCTRKCMRYISPSHLFIFPVSFLSYLSIIVVEVLLYFPQSHDILLIIFMVFFVGPVFDRLCIINLIAANELIEPKLLIISK